jgi:hypothetical protein
MSLFDKLFGKKKEEEKEQPEQDQSKQNVTFSATTMSAYDLAKLKVGDVVQLGQTDQNKQTYELKWIEANENPFQIRVLDCREYAINRISTTQNEEVAKTFLATRKSNGTEYIGKFPNNGAKAEVDLTFHCKHQPEFKNGVPDGVLFKAQTMEQKWDIYKYVNFMFFVRSWTGELVYLTNYIPTEDGFKVDLIVLDDSKIDEADPFHEFKVVEFLIHSHVLNLQVPHPLPKKLEDIPEKIAAYSFSMFGNRGYYGTYE